MMVKAKEEITKLKAAAALGASCLERALPLIVPGAGERGIAEALERFAEEGGGALYGGLSFPPIVASGENGADPHAALTDRLFKAGDFVTVDFGVVLDGYCSDMTRTFIVGGAAPTDKQAAVYKAVLDAQRAGVARAIAGMGCKALDAVCRSVIEGAGFGERFVHTTGHGIGTEVHEDPRIGKESQAVLEAGMAVTIEPGIYIEGWGGVRIEDTVIITDSGCDTITHFHYGMQP